MHGHDAHLVAVLLHVALHFEIAGTEVRDETLQRWCCLAVIAERETEKFLDGFRGLRAKPREQPLPHQSALRAEQFGEELVRRREIGARQPICEPRLGFGEGGIV